MSVETWRPFTSVIIWSDNDAHRSEMFFAINTRGDIRELKTHRTVKAWQFEEAISFAMFLGRAVTFDVCDREFNMVQRAEFQRAPVADEDADND